MVQVHCSRRRLLRGGLEFHVCSINKSAHTKKSGNLLKVPRNWGSHRFVTSINFRIGCFKMNKGFE